MLSQIKKFLRLRSTDTDRHFRSTLSTDSLDGFKTASIVLDISANPYEAPSPEGLSLSSFQLLKLLSSGGSGNVFLARYNDSKDLVALKIIAKKDKSPESVATILEEQHIQVNLSQNGQTSNVLPLIASFHDEANFYLVLPYMPGGDMAVDLARCWRYEGSRARFYAAEIVVALEALHAKKVIHRDIKPGNILLQADGHIVLADFGNATQFKDSDSKESVIPTEPSWVSFEVQEDAESGFFLKEQQPYETREVRGTPYYMCPEQHYAEPYSYDADYWSLGVVLFRMITGRMPFDTDGKDRSALAASVADTPLEFTRGDGVEPSTQDLLQCLMAKDRDNRLNIDEIKSHPYFRGIDWLKMARHEVQPRWTPYVGPAPRHAHTSIPIRRGQRYAATSDPHPAFQWRSSFISLYTPPPRPDPTTYGEKSTGSIRRFFKKVFSRSSAKMKGLRPLKLTRMARSPRSLSLPLARQDTNSTTTSNKGVTEEPMVNKVEQMRSPEASRREGFGARVKGWVRALFCVQGGLDDTIRIEAMV